MKKVLLALSGGVDSSVAAELLKRDGYYVEGVVMMMSPEHEKTVSAAKESALKLDIKLHILDLRDIFKETIIDYFANEYLSGRTPNPCVRCNPSVKFKYLLRTADSLGFDCIATGHYAKIVFDNGIYKLFRADSDARDQSYMLAGLKQDVLSRLICPLCVMEKQAVRKIAEDMGLPCHNAPDSQENCFIPDNDYASYIEQNYQASKVGDFISPDCERLCPHKGILHYTIGQRKGLGVALGRPAYVSDIDADSGEVRLSFEKALVNEVWLSDFSEIYENALRDGDEYLCKLRSTGKLMPCVAHKCGDGVLIRLKSPTPKVSSGQAGVIYNGDEVIGVGAIENNRSAALGKI